MLRAFSGLRPFVRVSGFAQKKRIAALCAFSRRVFCLRSAPTSKQSYPSVESNPSLCFLRLPGFLFKSSAFSTFDLLFCLVSRKANDYLGLRPSGPPALPSITAFRRACSFFLEVPSTVVLSGIVALSIQVLELLRNQRSTKASAPFRTFSDSSPSGSVGA